MQGHGSDCHQAPPPTDDDDLCAAHCDQDVPVTFVAQHIIIARPDPTDVEAHLLQHQEAR